MNHLPQIPHGPHHHHGRRQNDFHHAATIPTHMPSPHHLQYSNYPQPSHYQGPPQIYPYMQWYPNYQQYPSPGHRVYHPPATAAAPLIVSSHPNALPLPPLSRPIPPLAPRAVRTPLPEQSTPTPSTSSQTILSASTTPTTTSITISTPPAQPTTKPPTPVPVSVPVQTAVIALPPPASQFAQRPQFRLSLPWLSVPDKSFPEKSTRRLRKRYSQQPPSTSLELPSRNLSPVQTSEQHENSAATASELSSASMASSRRESAPKSPSPEIIDDVLDDAAPLTSAQSTSTDPSPVHQPISRKRATTKSIVPAVPIVPSKTNIALPPKTTSTPNDLTTAANETQPIGLDETTSTVTDAESSAQLSQEHPPEQVSAKVPPKSWAAILRNKGSSSTGTAVSQVTSHTGEAHNGGKYSSLANALLSYTVDNDNKISFLEPRGLVNTGNMCYMNSVLQVLVFCVPFYDFLSQVGRRAVHSFKSDTPLIEAMIMFMREFNIIDSAASVEQLRLRLKDDELEQYGEAFIPEYVYEAINRLPRFSSMRRGHQQDAEEFLGFFLEGLHDECAHILNQMNPSSEPSDSAKNFEAHSMFKHQDSSDSGGWLEVGPKQKAAVTRSSGAIAIESPITRIFGGQLRSEFRVPGLKKSVTLEPYQPLQLDIGASDVLNINDALKGLTRSETIQGDFNSPRGPGSHATKQVFIETLPPVLILHLKRFQYDNTGGTQKIWKKIGYPLELEIPKEVLPPHTRGSILSRQGGLPKYRLIGVVYHHGKNASGGHYTVDVRRQEGREWVRFDDTTVRRVRGEDVAREGGEEDPKILAKALEEHKRNHSADMNIYKQAGFDEDDDEIDAESRNGWSQVNGTVASPSSTINPNKKWSGIVVNGGTSTPSTAGKQTPRNDGKRMTKDNKVAYILFYQQIKV